jgi:HNH endonuclease
MGNLMRLKFIILLILVSALSYSEDSLQETSRALRVKEDSLQNDSRALGLVHDNAQNHISEESLINDQTQAKKNRKKGQSIPSKKEETADLINNDINRVTENSEKNHFSTILIVVFLFLLLFIFKGSRSTTIYRDGNFNSDTWKRMTMSRRDYYIEVYLKSDEWQRKRYMVLKRDNWKCVYCGEPASEVHHKRYARKNIGKEPIDWLVSICKPCHRSEHNIKSPEA